MPQRFLFRRDQLDLKGQSGSGDPKESKAKLAQLALRDPEDLPERRAQPEPREQLDRRAQSDRKDRQV